MDQQLYTANWLREQCLRFRAQYGVKQREMAMRCGVNRCTIWRIETGKPVSQISQVKVMSVVNGHWVAASKS